MLEGSILAIFEKSWGSSRLCWPAVITESNLRVFPLWMWINQTEVLSKSNLNKSSYLSDYASEVWLGEAGYNSRIGVNPYKLSGDQPASLTFIEAEQDIPERTWGRLFEPVYHILPSGTLRDDFLTDPTNILKNCFDDRTAVGQIKIEI